MNYSINENIINAKISIKNRLNNKRLIHHSDRDLQYCSEYYQTILNQNEIIPTITNNCYQNTLNKIINGIFKQVFLIEKTKDINELIKIIVQGGGLYNNTIPHLSLNIKHTKFEEIKSFRIKYCLILVNSDK